MRTDYAMRERMHSDLTTVIYQCSLALEEVIQIICFDSAETIIR